MERRAVLLCVFLAWISAPALARAEELTTRGNLVLSAERLFGIYLDNVTIERGGRDDTIHHGVVGLGWSNTDDDSTLAAPRLGVDYFISNEFTLGGNLGFISSTRAGTTRTSFMLGLRAGYALRLGHVVTIWPRGGLGFRFTSIEGAPSDSHLMTFGVEVPFAFALTEGFAITAGPTLDIGFSGKTFGADSSELLFGLMIGLSGWFGL